MIKAVIIVAGGSGTRMQSSIPKQFLLLRNRPILMHTIDRFVGYDANVQVILVLPEVEIGRWEQLCSEYGFTTSHSVAIGGETRFHSVKNGLALVAKGSLIAIHDGVRPLVSADVIARCFDSAAHGKATVPVVTAVDSLREVTTSGNKALNRSSIRLVQTPQVFPYDMLMDSYQQEFTPLFTDDASVVEAKGYDISLVEGNVENIKITNPIDLLVADRVYDAIR